MKITYFVQNEGGCDYYRAILPLETMAKNGHEVRKITPGKYFLDVETNPERFQENIMCDVMFIPRITSLKFFRKIIALARDYNPNIKIVSDYDDNVFSVSPMSPHYSDYGTEPVKIKFSDGSYKSLWEDGMMFGGKPLSFASNRRRLEEIKTALKEADMVLTTTNRLGKVLEEQGANVRVAPNSVDTNIWRPIPLEKDDTVRLVWAGAQSHYEDWFTIKDVVREVMDRFKNTKLLLYGCKWDRTLDGIDPDRIEFHGWLERAAYPYEMMLSNADIGLIPLRDTEFNRCKSAIKWIEYGSLGIPSVCPLIHPYKKMMKYGDNGAYVENNNQKSWVKALSYLIESKPERERLGKNALKTVKENFDINKTWKIWEGHLEEVLNGRAVKSNAV